MGQESSCGLTGSSASRSLTGYSQVVTQGCGHHKASREASAFTPVVLAMSRSAWAVGLRPRSLTSCWLRSASSPAMRALQRWECCQMKSQSFVTNHWSDSPSFLPYLTSQKRVASSHLRAGDDTRRKNQESRLVGSYFEHCPPQSFTYLSHFIQVVIVQCSAHLPFYRSGNKFLASSPCICWYWSSSSVIHSVHLCIYSMTM